MKFYIILAIFFSSVTSFEGKSFYLANSTKTFDNTQETQSFVGNGFSISHDGNTYALTAKHVLFEKQNSWIKTIDIQDYFDSWKLKPFNAQSGEVELSSLLNSDSSEQLDISILQDDWILIEIKNNTSPQKALEETNTKDYKR